MTTEVRKESEKRSFGELFTILGFQLAMTVASITWISTSMHRDVDRIHNDMTQIRTDFKSEHAHHAARQDAVTARIDLAYHLLYQNLKRTDEKTSNYLTYKDVTSV